MRLIDADAFAVATFKDKSEEFINGAQCVLEMLDKSPTAYDVDSVVEQLTQKQDIYVCSNDDYEEGKYNAYGDAIKIVLNGGKEQK